MSPAPRLRDSGLPDGRSTRGGRDTGLTELVRRRILDAILANELRPGQLIQTGQLAQRYQVSRTPVREALGTLEREGVVTVLPYRGYLVREITLEEARDIYFMRTVIEGAAAERAASRITPEQLDALLEPHAPSEPEGKAYSTAFDQYFNEFHRRIAAAAGSPRLADALEGLFRDVRRLQSLSSHPPSPEQIEREHLEIHAALRSRDPAQARAAMDRHIRSLYRETIQTID
jgi:GntR family transcriptional regulator, rspAB operon transcriptional repressor